MVYAPAADAGHSGTVAGHLCHGQAILWRRRRALLGTRARDSFWPIYFYQVSHSRCAGRPMAHFGFPLLSAITRRAPAFALDLLGLCGNLCAKRTHERFDRPGISRSCDRVVPDSYRQSTAQSETEAFLQHPAFLFNRGSLAHSGVFAEPYTRHRPWLLMVLLRQRALSALSEQARASRLRHSPSSDLLGVVAFMAAALECVFATSVERSPRPLARAEIEPRCAKQGESAVRSLGSGDCRLLQLLHAPGVLHDSGAAGHGTAGRGLASTRGQRGGSKPGAPSGQNFLDSPLRNRCNCICDRDRSADVFQACSTRNRPG